MFAVGVWVPLVSAGLIGTIEIPASSISENSSHIVPAAVGQFDCRAFRTVDNGAAAQCLTTQPGTIQVVIECTTVADPPFASTVSGPVVPAEAYRTSSATCRDGTEVSNYFVRYRR